MRTGVCDKNRNQGNQTILPTFLTSEDYLIGGVGACSTPSINERSDVLGGGTRAREGRSAQGASLSTR